MKPQGFPRRRPVSPIEHILIDRELELEIAGRVTMDHEVDDVRVYFRGVDLTRTFSAAELEDFKTELIADHSEFIVDELAVAKAARELSKETA